jgi:succinate---hydroxymethylglutarate CoA-transferase
MVVQVDHPKCGPMKLVNTPVKFSLSTPSVRSPPPWLGQHTEEILREQLGMAEKEIKRLRAAGIIA